LGFTNSNDSHLLVKRRGKYFGKGATWRLKNPPEQAGDGLARRAPVHHSDEASQVEYGAGLRLG
jgi:hypothetical protein